MRAALKSVATSAKAAATVTRYDNAYTNPGPLAEIDGKHNLNFYGGRYNSRVLTEDTIYYRAGDSKHPYGRYFVENPPKSVIQVRMDTAVKPYWTDVKTNTFNINQDTGKLEVFKSPIEKSCDSYSFFFSLTFTLNSKNFSIVFFNSIYLFMLFPLS